MTYEFVLLTAAGTGILCLYIGLYFGAKRYKRELDKLHDYSTEGKLFVIQDMELFQIYPYSDPKVLTKIDKKTKPIKN